VRTTLGVSTLDLIDSIDSTGELLIHFHIPKTGGTAFHFLFDKTNCGFKCHGVKNAYKIISYFDSNREQCGFFSQEFSNYGELLNSLSPDSTAKMLVFFRTPMSHVISAIGHMKRKRLPDCYDIKSSLSDDCKFYQLNNMQTTIMGNRDINVAIQNVRSLFWIGITEHYDASICLLSYQLGQFDNHKCNCTGKLVKPMNRGARFEYSVSDLGEVSKATDLDSILYQEAYKIFLLRIHHAEKILGYDILCENRDGIDALQLKQFYASLPVESL
jgi:hypothetical protein